MPDNKKYIIIMMSNNKTDEGMVYSDEAGVDEYIAKPFNIRLLEAQMKKILKSLH
ncbi:hypothetical protein [Paenibacillus sp. J2TS4]|uniref:hypothetical protein n=1 Tax=Paenibacillus sp. J2TS4 TaxID=2807194 RepID=UPI001B0B4B23|nr:hypothetical protein [Paenibacillus sp. J2TS4]GIP33445.1 hypothetical protein J2TS4_26550 [Paenibacillus sp. J2TS4]